MAEKTGIAWTNATWNPVRGCERVSQACVNCYAEVLAAKHSYRGGWGDGIAKWITRSDGTKEARWTGVIRTMEHMLDAPLRWKTPRRIFVNSMSDLFHKDVPFAFVDRIVAIAAIAQQHTYQALTKRADRMLKYWSDPEREAFIAAAMLSILGPRHAISANFLPLRNWWHGVSAEDQKTFDERVESLGRVPATVRFISLEPLLGEIDVGNALDDAMPDGSPYGPVHWGIIGGESGRGHRTMEIEHARLLIRQFKLWKKPIFVKQDSGSRPGMQGRFTAEEWALKEYPGGD
jgi:protein gp37